VSTAPAPEKKPATSLTRIVLGVGLVLSAAAVAGGVVIYRWAHDPRREVVIALVAEAQRRPGARSVKDLGCDMAMIQDDADYQAIAESQGRKLGDPIPSGFLVSCLRRADNTKPEPTCALIATVYGKAVREPPKKFFVQVLVQGGEAPVKKCEGVYSPQGELLEPASFR
jgi:hypothetical protein